MQGLYVALITPFNDDFSLNEKKLIEMIERQIEGKTDGLLPCGTTGETPALSSEEKKIVVSTAVNYKAKFQKVMAGSGTNNTLKTIDETQKVADLGVDYALVITPYYNKPNQEGLYRHFSMVLDSSSIPVVIYNVPSRTGVNILPETIERLADHEKLISVKEASGNLAQVSELVKKCSHQLSVMSGDDVLTTPIMSVGGTGVVSVSANIVPAKMKELVDSYTNKNIERALEIHQDLLELHKNLFVESNPIPAKIALNQMGLEVGPVRVPLGPGSEQTKKIIHKTISDLGLL